MAYVLDPSDFLQEATGETTHSLMPTGLSHSEQEALDAWSFLATFPLVEGETGEQ